MSRSRQAHWLVLPAGLLVTFIFVAPIVWMFLASFKNIQAIFSIPPVWIPDFSNLDNYKQLFSENWRFLLYSVVVTLGAHIEILRAEVEDLPVEIVQNTGWESGMSGSIKVGLHQLLDDAVQPSAVIVMVCDQPFVTAGLLEKIIAKFHETGSLIVACAYQNTLDTPALFHQNLFPELLALDARTGAKRLIKKYRSATTAIAFPEGAFDVDTPGDYENLLTGKSEQ